MNNIEEFEPEDPALTTKEEDRIASLTLSQVALIDSMLLAHCSGEWRKLAYIVASAMGEQHARIAGVPDLYFAQRLRSLVVTGQLEARGDLRRMRYSELRVAAGHREHS